MSRAPAHRLFVAIYPDASAAAVLAAHAARVDAEMLKTFRPTAAALVHMTLLFIGDTTEYEMADVTESISRAVAGMCPFAVRTDRLAGLPDADRPRLIAAATDSPPGLLEIQRRLASRLARNRRDRRDGRFQPHITIGRFVPGFLGNFPTRTIEPITFEVRHIQLMRSVLRPEGALHSMVEGFPLDGK